MKRGKFSEKHNNLKPHQSNKTSTKECWHACMQTPTKEQNRFKIILPQKQGGKKRKRLGTYAHQQQQNKSLTKISFVVILRDPYVWAHSLSYAFRTVCGFMFHLFCWPVFCHLATIQFTFFCLKAQSFITLVDNSSCTIVHYTFDKSHIFHQQNNIPLT